MHSAYPFYANPMPYAPSEDPKAKEISSHIKMDPGNSPYQPWPYGGSYCYPVPQGYHGCSNYGYLGGPYSFQPPYPHYPPPPPLPLLYPPFPGAYPAYSFPPPHYSVEQPRYDYDKHGHGSHHCCGCNHKEDEKKSRIEREEPEVDKRTNDSLVPSVLKDYPYPIMWLPPGFTNTESKPKEKEKNSNDPVLLKPVEPSKRGGGNDETESDKLGGDGNCLPFPMYWFPSKKNEEGEDMKGSSFSGSDGKKRETRNIDEDPDSEAKSDSGSKHAVLKVIPVKQLGLEEDKKNLKSIETKATSTDKGVEGKASPKTSKLPPVCLRVDPLPRRKNGSRSPSPPGDKGRSLAPPENSKSSQQQTQLPEGLKKDKEEQSNGTIKTIEVTSDANKVERDGDKGRSKASPENLKSSQQQTQLPEGLKKGKEEQSNVTIRTIEVTSDANKVERDDVTGPCENVPRGESNGSEKERQEGREPCKVVKKELSQHEAVLKIQSVYRGFEVRKSKPIMKLRQIAGIRKQVVELRSRIQELESSSSICVDGKQKLVIGEIIMSLLLKLDTIQGLHPTVRDIRKSVAKELVGLQEKLDSLTFMKSGNLNENTSASTSTHLEDVAIGEKSDQLDNNVKLVESGIGLCENLELEPRECGVDGGKGFTGELNENQLQEQHLDQKHEELQNKQGTGKLSENWTEQPPNQEQNHSNSESASDIEGAMHLKDDLIQEKYDAQLKSNLEVDKCGVDARDTNFQAQVELAKEENMGELKDHQLPASVEAQAQEQSNSNKEDGADARDTIFQAQVELAKEENMDELKDHQFQASVEAQAQEQSDSNKEDGIKAEQSDGNNVDGGIKVEQSDSNKEDGIKAEQSGSNNEDGGIKAEQSGSNNKDGGIKAEQSGSNNKDGGIKAEQSDSNNKDGGIKAEQSGSNNKDGGIKVDDMKHEQVVEESSGELNRQPQICMGSEQAVESGTAVEGVKCGSEHDGPGINHERSKVLETEQPVEQVESDTEGNDKDETQEVGGEVDDERVVTTGAERKVMEENEKLRAVVEELMKAGKEQMGVIKELTGRVKDLEKKLSKQKKKGKVNKCRSRRRLVQDELGVAV